MAGMAKGHRARQVRARVDLCQLGLCSGETDLQAFDLAEPAFAFGFGDAGYEVVADLGQAAPLGRVGPEKRAADTGMLVDARGGERTGASPDRHLSPFEMAEELLPFVVCRDAVLLAGPQ